MSQTFFHSIKSEARETLSLSVPLVISQLIYACSGFISTAFVAQLGEEALAANVLVSTIWMSLSILFFGILNAVSVLVSHQYSARAYENIGRVMGQAFILGVILMFCLFGLLSLVPKLLLISSQPLNVIAIASEYTYSLFWMIPSLILLIIFEQFLIGANRTRIVLQISLLIVPIEIPLIYLLIFGKMGLPAFGIAGVGYGFAITYTFTAICLAAYLLHSQRFQQFSLFSYMSKFDFRWFKELLRIGLPAGLMHLIEVGAFAVATFWMATFGTTMLAAHQIVMQYVGFFIVIIFAISQAVTVRVGYFVGNQNSFGIRYAIYVGMGMNFILMLLVALAFHFFPLFFLSLDINVHAPENQLLVQDASKLLFFGGLMMVFDNFRVIGFGALRGLKDLTFSMFSSLLSFWLIGLGLAYLFAFKLPFNGPGIWWGLTIGIACGASIIVARIEWLLPRIKLKNILHV